MKFKKMHNYEMHMDILHVILKYTFLKLLGKIVSSTILQYRLQNNRTFILPILISALKRIMINIQRRYFEIR